MAEIKDSIELFAKVGMRRDSSGSCRVVGSRHVCTIDRLSPCAKSARLQSPTPLERTTTPVTSKS